MQLRGKTSLISTVWKLKIIIAQRLQESWPRRGRLSDERPLVLRRAGHLGGGRPGSSGRVQLGGVDRRSRPKEAVSQPEAENLFLVQLLNILTYLNVLAISQPSLV